MAGRGQPPLDVNFRSKAEAIGLACLEASPFIEDQSWRFSWYESPYSLFSEGLTRAHQEQGLEEAESDEPFHCRLCRAHLNVTSQLDPYSVANEWTAEVTNITATHTSALEQLSPNLRCDFWDTTPHGYERSGCEYSPWDWTDPPRTGFPHGFGNTWLASAQFDHDPISKPTTAHHRRWIKAYRALSKSVGWWIVFGDSVLLVPKPNSSSHDSEGMLHGASEPAVVYPDGWGFYACHGRVLPDGPVQAGELTLRQILTRPDQELRAAMLELVDDEELDREDASDLILSQADSRVRQAIVRRFGPARLIALVGAPWVLTTGGAEFRLSTLELLDDKTLEEAGVADLVLKETNAEVRQRLLARFGPDRVADALGARQLAKDRFGELWLVPAQIDRTPSNSPYRQERLVVLMEPMKFVRVIEATSRPDGRPIYWLPVPMEMTSAREAVAWTFGLSKYEYRPEVET